MELLVLVLVLLGGTLGSGIKEKALDMAPNAFDDQYKSCRTEMEKKLRNLVHSELDINKDFARAWAKASEEWKKRHRQQCPLQQDQAIALLAYTDSALSEAFKTAMAQSGPSAFIYCHNFHFKALHFLLTMALSDKAHPQGTCLTVFRGAKPRFTAKRGQTVRFGHFASSSLKEQVTKKFGTNTFFKVETCHGAFIRDFSFYPKEDEVLIPPFETFQVISVSPKKEGVHIHLRSSGTCSNYHCEFTRAEKCKNKAKTCKAGRSIHRDPLHIPGLLLTAVGPAAANGTH
ncbi:PREDICTED: erythroblast NAD(P)(+)--arginine ADP-ribosyltransferase-like [Acanthisitta chloris]|uniref:erythroblast NAD(P)(+)--arginine ADP-ribosyltransferase-like n=1 Tax=Acanthisitta chloris TaxID=57068 RepID=UPI0004F0EA25|nr:PREDICTED: erythroblast NAD(P)(+)--arginine ADP-ribosyltransferase-like [Acanthisitta chloris]